MTDPFGAIELTNKMLQEKQLWTQEDVKKRAKLTGYIVQLGELGHKMKETIERYGIDNEEMGEALCDIARGGGRIKKETRRIYNIYND